MRKIYSLSFFCWWLFLAGFSQEKVMFTAADGLEVTADCYEPVPGNPMVVLCHQAGWSRGEYK
jgi:hypothetical protein